MNQDILILLFFHKLCTYVYNLWLCVIINDYFSISWIFLSTKRYLWWAIDSTSWLLYKYDMSLIFIIDVIKQESWNDNNNTCKYFLHIHLSLQQKKYYKLTIIPVFVDGYYGLEFFLTFQIIFSHIYFLWLLYHPKFLSF